MKARLARLLAAAMAVVLLAFVALFAASEWGEAQKRKWQWGFVDASGQTVIPLNYEGARGFAHGRAAVKEGGLWGLMTRDGSWAVSPRFAQICDYGGTELTCAQDRDTRMWGYVDDSGNWALEARWSHAYPMSEGLGAVGDVVGVRTTRISGSTSQRVHHFGLIARDGTMVVDILAEDDPHAWSTVGEWGEDLLPVQIGHDRFGYVNRAGAVVIEPIYRAARPFRSGFAAVAGGRGWAVVNLEGEVVVAEKHGTAHGFSEGFLAGPTGYHRLDGEQVSARYAQVLGFSEGRGAVSDGGAWGFVDAEMNVVIEPTFRRVTPFADGHAAAAISDGRLFVWGILDAEGSWTVEPRFEGVDPQGFREGLLAVGDD